MNNIMLYEFDKAGLYKRDLNKDLYISLSWDGKSRVIKRAFEGLLKVVSGEKNCHVRSRALRIQAAKAYVFDLMQIYALGCDEWGYRSFRKEAFAGQRIGYKPFKWVHDRLKDIGFIEQKNGYYDHNAHTGYSTRVRPTAAFLRFMLSYGITPSNFRVHYELAERPSAILIDPVRVRASKTGDWLNPQKGRMLPVDPNDPTVAVLLAQVRRLNEWFAGHRLEHPSIPGPMHAGFYRLFNQGDREDFAFNKGARLYNLGAYQRIERKERPALLIDGQPVFEVDVAGSHLTMLHAMLDVPLLPSVDPYDVPGIPRAVVKKFIVMALGNGRFQNRWSLSIAKEYEGKHGTKLQADYPLKVVREATLNRLPTLRGLPDSGITWADLQYRESQGLIGTVEALAYEYGIPAYPLHDSVIVPASKQDLVVQVMKEAFKKHAGTTIRVTVNGG